VEPSPVANSGRAGFKDLDAFEPTALKRAPTPKLRMQVLARDNRKCRICGRSPSNYSDIELHVHHIRPWAKGGITGPDNLITLCHTCHDGLEPHFDANLYSYLKEPVEDALEEKLRGFRRGVANYRQVGFFGGLEGGTASRRPPSKRARLG
jgi:ribosomal protein S14